MSHAHHGTPQTRQRIIDGAGRVFAQKGVRTATIQDVLDAAQVSRRTFYQYFKGKDGVLDALFEQAIEDLSQRMLLAIAAADQPEDKLDAAIAAFLDRQQAAGELARVLAAEAVRPDSPLFERRARAFGNLVHLLDQAVFDTLSVRLDPYIFKVLLHGVDGLIRHIHDEGGLKPGNRARVEAIIKAMWFNVLKGREDLPQRPADPA